MAGGKRSCEASLHTGGASRRRIELRHSNASTLDPLCRPGIPAGSPEIYQWWCRVVLVWARSLQPHKRTHTIRGCAGTSHTQSDPPPWQQVSMGRCPSSAASVA